jgi:cell division septation protein DedD
MLPDPNDRPVRTSARGSSLPLRGITIGFAAFALTVFGALIGWTYLSHTGGSGGPVPLIKADTRPVKTAPEKPGGMDVPNQDKEIYARIDRNAPPPPQPRVERLLPPPESPMPRPRPPAAPAPLEPEIPVAPSLEPPPNAVEVPQTPPAQPPRTATPAQAPAPTPAPAKPTAPAPQQQAQAPRAAAPAPAPAPNTTAGSRFRIQLAALRTSEDATREWDKLRRAHSDLLGPLTLNVVRADLGDRGTFYRIQAGPLADERTARDLCHKLAEKKVGCLVVRP